MEETSPAATEGVLHHTEGVDLIPASIELSGIGISLINAMSRETIFRQYIQIVKPAYDYIIVDTSPSLGILPAAVIFSTKREVLRYGYHLKF